MSGWILAVDFGTVNTGAAVRFADGRVDKVKLDPNSDTMPSAVVVTEGRWRVGQAALNARRTHPDTFIGSPKTRLGQEPVVLGDDLASPATIAAHVLAAVREKAVRATWVPYGEQLRGPDVHQERAGRPPGARERPGPEPARDGSRNQGRRVPGAGRHSLDRSRLDGTAAGC